ncbi:MAG: hypothetical protein ACTSV7_09240 [Candidatus Baldrarchaeia archaeon]
MTQIRYFVNPKGKYLPLTGGTINGDVNIYGGLYIKGQSGNTVALKIDTVINAGPANGTMLEILNYDNDTPRKVIRLVDENSNEDFYIQSSLSNPLMYFRGTANVGSLQIGGTEVIDSSRTLKNVSGDGTLLTNLNADKLDGYNASDFLLKTNSIEKITEINVSTDVQYVDITNIPQYDFYILFIKLVNGGSTGAYRLFVDGDYTNTNYYTHYIYYDGSSVSGAKPNSNYIAYCSADKRGILYIVLFRNSLEYALFLSYSLSASTNLYYGRIHHTSTAPDISSLRFYCDGTYGVGSGTIITLYGVK